MATTNISIRVDKELKKQADSLFNELGLNMSTAFNIFIRQAVREGKIPFDISLNEQSIKKHQVKHKPTKTIATTVSTSISPKATQKDDNDFDSPFDTSTNQENRDKLLAILEAEKGAKSSTIKEHDELNDFDTSFA